MGVIHEGLDSPAISVNIRWGWKKTGNNRAKSNRRAGAEGFDSVIVFIPVKLYEKFYHAFKKRFVEY
jgi:hypothetical protein